MGKAWIIVAVVLALLGSRLGSVPLLMIAVVIMALALVSRWWARYSLARLEYHRSLSAYRVFAGEEIQFFAQLTNRKFLPLPWVQVIDELPREVTPIQGRTNPAPDPMRMTLTSLFSMMWYQRTTRTYTLRCEQRGYFALGPARIRSGDLFGLFTREMRIDEDHYLVVYPPVLPIAQPRLPSRDPYGDVRVRRIFLDDVTRPMGSREYVVGDSLRHVHWKSTARTSRLQTRIFDASTNVNLVLFLDVRTVEHPLLGTRPHLLELGIVTTTALSNYALERGYPVGVYVNQTSRFTPTTAQVPPARHAEQLDRILEVMAQVHPFPLVSQAEHILGHCRHLPWGTTIVAVTATPDDMTLAALTRLRRSGWAVSLVHIGGPQRGFSAEGIPTYTVSDAVDWRELQEVVLL